MPVPIVFADVQTEVRAFRGNVYVSMATIVIDGKNEPEARITARLRMPLAAATDLARSIQVATEPIVLPDKTTTN